MDESFQNPSTIDLHRLVEVYRNNDRFSAVCACGWVTRAKYATAAEANAAHKIHAAGR